jgi:hypothetical protein
MEMNAQQAISVLIQGCELGQKAGAYNFEDAEMISKAIKVFIKPATPATPAVETAEETSKTETENQTQA